jgi:hypothetical protein
MPLTPSTSFTQDADDINLGVVEDTTSNYGTGGNPARSDAANYLLWAKVDENGARTFDNPDPGNVLTIMEWEVNTPVAGWYQRMLMRIQFYVADTVYVPEQSSGGVITQYASITYYEEKVYKYINASSSSGNLPTDADYWEEVTDLSTLISNTNISNTISDTYVRAHADDGVKDLFAAMAANCGCDEKANKRAYTLDGLLIAADSAVESGNYDDMEKIIRTLESKLAQAA